MITLVEKFDCATNMIDSENARKLLQSSGFVRMKRKVYPTKKMIVYTYISSQEYIAKIKKSVAEFEKKRKKLGL